MGRSEVRPSIASANDDYIKADVQFAPNPVGGVDSAFQMLGKSKAGPIAKRQAKMAGG